MNQLDHLKEPSTSESSDDGSGSPTAGSQNQWKYTCPLEGCDFNARMYAWRMDMSVCSMFSHLVNHRKPHHSLSYVTATAIYHEWVRKHKNNKNERPIRYCGGMNTASGQKDQNLPLQHYTGIRLNNFRNDCYLNSTVNSIITNPILMQELNKPYPSLDATTQSIIQQIQNLATSPTHIKNVRALKSNLNVCFPHQSYSTEEQNDAAQPFYHIIQCVPNLADKFNITATKLCTCLECGLETNTTDNTISFIDFSTIPRQGDDFQSNINQWCNRSEHLEKRCECTTHVNGQFIKNEQQRRSTKHQVSYQITGVPNLLYVKVRDLHRRYVSTNMAQSFVINNTTYHLKSSMLYTPGAVWGKSGHWRCVVKESGRYIMYDDAQQPTQISSNQLQAVLNDGSDFIYIAEETNNNPEVSSTSPVTETSNISIGNTRNITVKQERKESSVPQLPQVSNNLPDTQIEVIELDCSPTYVFFTCANCEYRFLGRDQFEVHQTKWEHRGYFEEGNNDSRATFKCAVCDEDFEMINQLKQHISNASDPSTTT